MSEWILTTERIPEPGQLVVKYWTATSNVWAGKHIAHAKHESFDKWIPLPVPNVELTGAARLYRAASSDRRERG